MKILIIDQDENSLSFVQKEMLEAKHNIQWCSSKSVSIKRIGEESFDCIIFDPAPLKSSRPLILDIRRHTSYLPYLLLMSEDLKTFSNQDIVGVHDTLLKPLVPELIQEKFTNAQRYCNLFARLNDISQDFPSAGGVVSKSAFKQLFLSAIERSDRYEEQTYFMFITVKNYKDILNMDGRPAADYIMANLSKNLVKIRRQSDIIGQTDSNELTILMRAPMEKSEPTDAANRFAKALVKSNLINQPNMGPVELSISLLNIPRCEKGAEHHLVFKRAY